MSGASTGFLRIARVLKSYGTEGEILMGFRDIDPEDLNLEEPVFIIFDGLPVPFFIESFQTRGTSRALVRPSTARLKMAPHMREGAETAEDEEQTAERNLEHRESVRGAVAGHVDGDSLGNEYRDEHEEDGD